MDETPTIDLTLLSGISFRCRPGCGLCCYTTPAVEPVEAARLLQLDPTAPMLEGDDGWQYVASQGEGGACHFLSSCECRAYPGRPFCCQEFPLSVHIGLRAQATVVLSCPGVSAPDWDAPALQRTAGAASNGLAEELAAVGRELTRQPVAQRQCEAGRRWRSLERRLARTGDWADPLELRSSLPSQFPSLVAASYPPAGPPPASEGIDALPLFVEPGAGLVAISDHPAGWELLSIDEAGRTTRSLGVWPSPTQRPSVAEPGGRVFRAYLEYLVDRDFTYWAAAERVRHERVGSLGDAVAEDLGRFGALVLARAQLIQRFRSQTPEPLSAALVWDGIRATDGEFLDRPTLGWVL